MLHTAPNPTSHDERPRPSAEWTETLTKNSIIVYFNMAYNGSSDRELRFRSQHETSLLSHSNGNRLPPPPVQDGRGGGGLMRRFTTDSSRVPTLSTITVQRGQQDSSDFGPSVCYCFFSKFVVPSHRNP